MDFFKKYIIKNKNVLVFGLIVVLVVLVLPHSTSALTWLNIGGAASSFFLGIGGVILLIPAYFAYLFALLAGALLNLVTSPGFISLSYTDPARNQVIKIGLDITKQFVNMGLVVALIFIALATALKIKEYAAQKTLIRLIAVALLVNFAPVICGLIVDAANIVTNYFLAGILRGISDTLTQSTVSFSMFGKLIESIGDFKKTSPLFAQVGIYMILNLSIAFAFLVLAAIFLVRHIAIWILVILAPLAFVAWILPATKKFWDQWWQQFIQWSIIGIPLSFFLYLAMRSFRELQRVFQIKMTAPGLEPAAAGAFDYALPFFVVLVIIWLGFIIGLQTSAMGATGIISFAKTKGKAGAKWAAKRIPEGTMAATAGAFRGLAKGAKEGKGLGRITGAITGAAKGAATYEGREKGREKIGKALERMHLVRPGAYEAARRKRWKIEEETKRLDTLPTDRLHEIAQRAPITPADRRGAIAAFEVLAKRSALKDEEKDLLPKMQAFGADTKQALKARPDWASSLKDEKGIPLKISKVVAGASTRDFTKNTQAEALKNIDVLISLDAPKIQNIGLHGSTEQKRALREATTPGSTTWGDLNKLADRLIQENNEKEFERITDITKEILRNPNFRQ